MNIYEMTLNDFLDIAASKSPTPGGGSVSAVVAANAAAMVSMVANLTIGKKAYEAVKEEAQAVLTETTRLTGLMKELTEKDMQAFQEFMSAWKLPSATDEEKAEKDDAMERAAKNASLVPLELCGACLQVLKLAQRLAPVGNKTAISDVGVGVHLALAALKSSMLSVDINLPLVHDAAFKDKLTERKARLLTEAEETALLALADVKKRL